MKKCFFSPLWNVHPFWINMNLWILIFFSASIPSSRALFNAQCLCKRTTQQVFGIGGHRLPVLEEPSCLCVTMVTTTTTICPGRYVCGRGFLSLTGSCWCGLKLPGELCGIWPSADSHHARLQTQSRSISLRSGTQSACPSGRLPGSHSVLTGAAFGPCWGPPEQNRTFF